MKAYFDVSETSTAENFDDDNDDDDARGRQVLQRSLTVISAHKVITGELLGISMRVKNFPNGGTAG